jgi:hypothetical protein
MKVLMAFLLVCFFLGGLEARRQRPTRTALLVGLSLLVTAALYSYNYV